MQTRHFLKRYKTRKQRFATNPHAKTREMQTFTLQPCEHTMFCKSRHAKTSCFEAAALSKNDHFLIFQIFKKMFMEK